MPARFHPCLLADDYAAFLAVAPTIALGSQSSQPSRHALVGDIAAGAERDILLAWNRSLRDRGTGFGGLVAGALLVPHPVTGAVALTAVLAAAGVHTAAA